MILCYLLALATTTPAHNIQRSLETLFHLDADVISTSTLSNTETLRLRNTTAAAFENIFSTTIVPVFVIEDATRNSPMDGWTCASIASKFSEVRMRREYDNNAVIDPYTQEPANHVRLGDAYQGGQEDWTTQYHDNGDEVVVAEVAVAAAAAATTTTSGGNDVPKFAPNYLPWKEFGPRNRQGISWLTVFQQYIKTPYFLRDDEWSKSQLLSSPEMWFAAVKGSGAKTHADGHCEATISIQLSGRKQWRVGPMHPVHKWGGLTARADDGLVKNWTPSHVLTLEAGEAVVFPAGMLHQTIGLNSSNNDAGDDTCAASITFQWVGPLASAYLRHHMPRLLLSGAVEECWHMWEYLVTGAPAAVLRTALGRVHFAKYVSLEEREERRHRGEEEEEEEKEEEKEEDKVAGEHSWRDDLSSWDNTRRNLMSVAVEVTKVLFERADINKDLTLSQEELSSFVETWEIYEHPRRGLKGEHHAIAADVLSFQDVDRDQRVNMTEHTDSVARYLLLQQIRSVLGTVRDRCLIDCEEFESIEELFQQGRSEFWFEMWRDPEYEDILRLLLEENEMKGACRRSIEQLHELIQVGAKLVLEKKKEEKREEEVVTNLHEEM